MRLMKGGEEAEREGGRIEEEEKSRTVPVTGLINGQLGVRRGMLGKGKQSEIPNWDLLSVLVLLRRIKTAEKHRPCPTDRREQRWMV